MSLGDYLPAPDSAWKNITGLFQKREGQPFVQGVARNLGHASFGDKIGNYVDQNWLGDPAPGATGPAGQVPQQGSDQSQQAMQALIQRWLQKK